MSLLVGFVLGSIVIFVVLVIGILVVWFLKARFVVNLDKIGFPAKVIMDRWYWKVTIIYNGQKIQHKLGGDHYTVKVGDAILDINFSDKLPLRFYRNFSASEAQ